MKFFLPNLGISKNQASVKCERVETAKKFGPEHHISSKTGFKWPKMAKYGQNASKCKKIDHFSQKIPTIDLFHLVVIYKHGFE